MKIPIIVVVLLVVKTYISLFEQNVEIAINITIVKRQSVESVC